MSLRELCLVGLPFLLHRLIMLGDRSILLLYVCLYKLVDRWVFAEWMTLNVSEEVSVEELSIV
jgi:hypothetical protein